MENIPKVVQLELESGLALALLKALGPNMGAALLPVVGIGPVQSKAKSLASDIATKWLMSDKDEIAIGGSNDKGGIPIPFMTLLAITDANAKLNSSGKSPENMETSDVSAIDMMKAGEVVFDGVSFSEVSLIEQFDFDAAIAEMEQKLDQPEVCFDIGDCQLKGAQDSASEDEPIPSSKPSGYDPDDRAMVEPVPINERLFPGLHLGWGSAKSSHTKREVLKMRLLSVILNKLGANYYRISNGENGIFSVRMAATEKPITTPSEFIQALIDSGHTVEAVPTSRITTFGIALCVKEDDVTWSHIPLAVFLESGYEAKDGSGVTPAMMPHSGLNLMISGPLAGTRKDGTPSELHVQVCGDVGPMSLPSTKCEAQQLCLFLYPAFHRHRWFLRMAFSRKSCCTIQCCRGGCGTAQGQRCCPRNTHSWFVCQCFEWISYSPRSSLWRLRNYGCMQRLCCTCPAVFVW
jgi:hypothetical protein